MICPVCAKPALSSERIGRLTWYTHEADVPESGPARWRLCADLKSVQERLVA